MGVPRLFKLLTERYPLIRKKYNDIPPPEFDNLYLDFNGIVHNCTHKDDDGSDSSAINVLSQNQMMLKIFAALEQMVNLVGPKKLLFISVDGVAPRAKMNQQRQRRFRSAYPKGQPASTVAATTKNDDGTSGGDEGDTTTSPDIDDSAQKIDASLPKPFDSNCITPGTEFMESLDEHLAYFVQKKLDSDNNWRKLEVIVSGHQVPGEGEHKIMEFIRSYKSLADYNPNTTHCLYGLDADLILLGLGTHEPHFCIVREQVIFKRKNKSKGIAMADDRGIAFQRTDEYELLHLGLLREYIGMEFALKDAVTNPADLERMVDDFICLSFLLGNDFLPHLPTADIDEGGIAGALSAYKRLRELYRLAQLDDELHDDNRAMFLVDGAQGDINLKFLEDLFVQFALFEPSYFAEVCAAEEERKFKLEQQKAVENGAEVDPDTGEIIIKANLSGLKKSTKLNRNHNQHSNTKKQQSNAKKQKSIAKKTTKSGGNTNTKKDNNTKKGVAPPDASMLPLPSNLPLTTNNNKANNNKNNTTTTTTNTNNIAIAPDPTCIPLPDAISNTTNTTYTTNTTHTTNTMNTTHTTNTTTTTTTTTPPSTNTTKPKPKGHSQFFHPAESKYGRALAPQVAQSRIGGSVGLTIKKAISTTTSNTTNATISNDDEDDHDEGVDLDEATAAATTTTTTITTLSKGKSNCNDDNMDNNNNNDNDNVNDTDTDKNTNDDDEDDDNDDEDDDDDDVDDDVEVDGDVDGDPPLPSHMQRGVFDKESYYHHHFNCSAASNKVATLCAEYLLGLVWVTKYYFQGIDSWTWYYPEIAAPLASDMVLLHRFSTELTYGSPVMPYQQLLAVLPPKSSQLLPGPLQHLFTGELSKCYPTTFARIPDSKGREWREILLIGFIDMHAVETSLQAALASVTLSASELSRNRLLTALVFSRTGNEVKLKPPPGSDLEAGVVHCSSKSFVPWAMPNNRFHPTPRSGCWLPPLSPPPGFPTFTHLDNVDSRSEAIGLVSLGSRPSDGETIVIDVSRCGVFARDLHHIDSSDVISSTTEDLNDYMDTIVKTRMSQTARSALTTVVFANFPFSNPATVRAVHDRTGVWEINRKGDTKHTRVDHNETWDERVAKVKENMLKHQGIDVGDVDLMFEVVPVVGMITKLDGSLQRITADEVSLIPGQLLRDKSTREDTRFVESVAVPAKQRLRKGTPCIFLGEQHYGKLAKLMSWVRSEKTTNVMVAAVRIESCVNTTTLETTVQALANNMKKGKYKSASIVSSIQGLPPLVLSRIFGAVTVETKTNERYNIGLGLKFARKGLLIPGYARRVTLHYDERTVEQWQYSERALALLTAFKQNFADFIRGVCAKPNEDAYDIDSVFVQENGQPLIDAAAQSRLEACVTWLEQHGTGSLPLVPCESSSFDDYEPIEQAAKQAALGRIPDAAKLDVMETALLPPLQCPMYHPSSQRSFQIGHRVVHVHGSGSIPFGLRGTIVSLCARNAEVIFDTPFLLGTTLNNRCKEPRGFLVGVEWLLNLSTKELFVPKDKATPASATKTTSKKGGGAKAKKKGNTNNNPFALLEGM